MTSCTPHDEESSSIGNLGVRAIRGAINFWIGKAGGFVVRLVINMVLARILVPEQFGCYALAYAYSELVGMVGAFNLNQALIQIEDGHERLFDTIISLTLAISLAVIMVGIAVFPLLYYIHGSNVAWYFLILVFSKLLSSISYCMDGRLQREFRYGLLAVINVISALIGSVIAVVAAASGAGAGALVVRDVFPMIVVIIAVWFLLRRSGVVIAWSLNRETARRVMSIGKPLFWSNLLSAIYDRVDLLIVGWFSGNSFLGFYERAKYLSSLPNAIMSPASSAVALKTFSIIRDNPIKLSRAIDLVQYWITRLVVLIGIIAFVAPDLVIRILYGRGWEEATGMLKWFSCWLVFLPIYENARALFTALEKWRPLVVSLALRVIVLIAFAIPMGKYFGPSGVIVASTIGLLIGFAYINRVIERIVHHSPGTFLTPAFAAIVTISICEALRYFLFGKHSFIMINVVLIACGVLSFILMLIIIERRRLLYEIRYILKRFGLTSLS